MVVVAKVSESLGM